jgi:hypothetical protein
MDARFEGSNNLRRYGKISQTGENFSTVVESCKNEFRNRPRTVTARRGATIIFESSVIETDKQEAKVERLQNNCASKAYRYEHRNWGS